MWTQVNLQIKEDEDNSKTLWNDPLPAPSEVTLAIKYYNIIIKYETLQSRYQKITRNYKQTFAFLFFVDKSLSVFALLNQFSFYTLLNGREYT